MFSRIVSISLNILLIALWLGPDGAEGKQKINGRSMQFTDVSVKYNETYISNYTAWINNHTLNLEVQTIKYLTYGLMAKLDLQIKLEGSLSYQSILRYDFDICKLLNENFREGIFRKNFKNILKYGNFMENCPIPEGRYYLRDFILESSSIPVYLRPGEYRIILNYRYRKEKPKTEDFFCYTKLDVKIL